MKTVTIQKRVSKVSKDLRGIAREVAEQLAGIKPRKWYFNGAIIRPCWTSGHGRFTTNLDHEGTICAVLDLLKIKYQTGNDAPRGGATGKFIKILTKIEE